MTVKPIPGQPPSADIRAELAASGQPVMLAFSRGKDAIATFLALRDAGVKRIVPYHMYLVPDLRFVRRDLERWERLLGTPIIDIPHPSLLGMLNAYAAQPADRVPHIVQAGYPDWAYEDILSIVRAQRGLGDTWIADGVRAADSPQRRVAFADHGVWKAKTRKVSPIYDWQKHEVMDRIAAEGWDLPPDYEWFGRSFDGIDYRFTEPLSRHAPEDFEQLRRWFPAIEAEILRHGLLVEAMSEVRRADKSEGWQARKRAEAVRYEMQTDGEFYLMWDFADESGRDAFVAEFGGSGAFVSGREVIERCNIDPTRHRGFGKPKLVSGKTSQIRNAEAAWLRKLPKVPDPFAGVSYSDPEDFAADMRAELAALMGAFPPTSQTWACIYFATRRHKLDFIAATGLGRFGERYMPGEKALLALRRAA